MNRVVANFCDSLFDVGEAELLDVLLRLGDVVVRHHLLEALGVPLEQLKVRVEGFTAFGFMIRA